jgi:biotin operon repressor
MTTKEEVLAAFKASAKPLKSVEATEILGAEKADVDKAIKALKAEGKLVSPKACYYAPAE